MKIFLGTMAVFFFLCGFHSIAFAQSPSPTATPTPTSVSSFELFWPIVAGKTSDEPLYFLKTLKEQLREALLFSSFKKADYNIMISVKRTVEAEKLLVEKKDASNGKATLEAAQQKRDKAYDYINKAKAEGKEVADLLHTLKNSLDKQKLLLESIKDNVEDEAKTIIDENITKLDSLSVKIQL